MDGANDAVTQTLLLRPDTVLMDAWLLGAGGIEACEQVRETSPQRMVVIFAVSADEEVLFDAIVAASHCRVLKRAGMSTYLACSRQWPGTKIGWTEVSLMLCSSARGRSGKAATERLRSLEGAGDASVDAGCGGKD